MIGTYVLSYQVYLALPLHARTLAGRGNLGTALVTALYVVSGGVTIVAQMKVTAWCRARWGPAGSLSRGLVVLGAAFAHLLAADALLVALPGVGAVAATAVSVVALLATAALLAIGTAVVLPFEMDTIVGLARNRLVATHYGFYNTVCGVGILLGNAGTGWAIDLARAAGAPYAPWLVLLVIGLLCGLALARRYRRGLLTAPDDDGSGATPGRAAAEPATTRLQTVDQHDDRPTHPLSRVRPGGHAAAAASAQTRPWSIGPPPDDGDTLRGVGSTDPTPRRGTAGRAHAVASRRVVIVVRRGAAAWRRRRWSARRRRRSRPSAGPWARR